MYTISNVTKSILLDIKEPINLKFYKSEAVNTIPGLSAYANRVEEFLQNYLFLLRCESKSMMSASSGISSVGNL